MNIRILLLILALSALAGCNDAVQTAVPESPQADVSRPLQTLEELTNNVLSFVKGGQIPPNCDVTETGSLDCDGYVPPNQDAPPEDWEPFEFKGQTYYFVPLAKANAQNK